MSSGTSLGTKQLPTHDPYVITPLGEDQNFDTRLYYKLTHDLSYDFLISELIKASLSTNKVKLVK